MTVRDRVKAAETFSRRYAAGDYKIHRSTFMREEADPAVRFILDHLLGSLATMRAEVAAGLGADTIRIWRYRGDPKISTLRRALQGMGYDLAVVDLATREVL